jgi:hypothetical protein
MNSKMGTPTMRIKKAKKAIPIILSTPIPGKKKKKGGF